MLQIRLSKPASESHGSAKPVPADSVTVACPDHLVLADLPVAKGLGSASVTAVTKTIGRRSRRLLGERVHFCVRCDFPIAIYGRLSPCEHAFCLDCARSDSLCFLCDERIQKIQTIKIMEGIFICAAPQCLKSFLEKTEFESHINEIHADLHPNKGNESEAISGRKSSASDSTVQAPPRSFFLASSTSQFHDHEDKSQQPQSRDQLPSRAVMHPRPMPPFPGQVPTYPLQQQPESNQSQVFDRSTPLNYFPQQTFGPRGGLQQNSVPVDPNSVIAPPQIGCVHYAPDGTQQFFGAPYETARQGSTPEPESEQGSLFGFLPGPSGPMNYSQNYPRPWNMGLAARPLEPPLVAQGTTDGFLNVSGPHGRGFFMGDYGQNVGILPSNLPPQGMEQRQGGNFVVPQLLPVSPPPPVPTSNLSRPERGRTYSSEENHAVPPASVGIMGRDTFGGGHD